MISKIFKIQTILLLFILSFCSLTILSCEDKTTSKTDMQSESNMVEKTKDYQDAHRPQFHFSPKEKWMNDPNGMVYYEGEYHLFYQYYPDSTVWGPMHWGHAVSPDMVNWEHLPIALYPDKLGYIFSGSAVVDWKNTSGFGKDGQPPLIAMFTHHEPEGEKTDAKDFQYQSIAYSNDKGRTWTKYEGNPVIPNTNNIRDFRDPKVMWDATHNQWLMVLAAKDRLQFWGSADLKNWKHLSDWGNQYGDRKGVWECPEIFPMQIEGTEETKWVVLLSINPGSFNGGSGTQYFVGDFDGKNFTIDSKFGKDIQNGKGVWIDYGRDNYAGVSWSDVPKEDGRRLFMGWMSNWDYAQIVPTEKWRSAMTLPRSLSLHNTKNGYRLQSQPVKELEQLRTETFALKAQTVSDKMVLTDKFKINAAQTELVLEIDLKMTTAQEFGIELMNDQGEMYKVGYDLKTNRFFSDRRASGDLSFSEKFAKEIHYSTAHIMKDKLKIHLFLDAASAEMFGDNGAIVMTDIFFPTEDFNKMTIYATGGTVALIEGEVHNLNAIWN